MTEVNYRRGSVKKYGKQRHNSREVNTSNFCVFQRHGYWWESWSPEFRRWSKAHWHRVNRRYYKSQLRKERP